MWRRMIEGFKRVVRRHWPRLRLRTILLLTFVFVAALPGVGALFLRVYENTLVRQTEAELIAQGAALAATATMLSPAPHDAFPSLSPEAPTVDLRMTPVLPDRPAPRPIASPPDRRAIAWSRQLRPILRMTASTTRASIQLLDAKGRILVGPDTGRSYALLPEVGSALTGRPATTLRRNDTYRPTYPFEWLSRASTLRIHHARPILADGRVIGVLLLARSPRGLFVGLHADRGKIALGVLLIFATLVMLSGLLSRGIIRPVEALGEATRAVASGGGTVPAAPTTAAIEIQALYRDFGTMAAAIEWRSRYLRDLAHAVSHEFKTPLAGIGGAVELLQDHPDMAAADRERFLANIAADAARLNQLVSRLLDLARADMARIADGVASDAAAAVRGVADAYAGIAVTHDLPSLPPVGVPGAVIETVLGGLIENSRQAGAARVEITGRTVPGSVMLEVRDDGPGIAPGDRARVFEPFFTSRRSAGGTGLGLPIARSLLHAHRAAIELAEAANGGAVFVITLPVTKG
jgi:signal transduction histidine kinase